MKKLAMVMLAAMPALAQSPGDFRWEAPVTVSGNDALNRLTLPFEVYRDAKPDFSDLRLFNAKGEALPIAFAGEPEPVRTEAAPSTLPIFPVAAEQSGEVSAAGSVDVQVKSDANGTIVSVQGRTAGKPAPARTASWLIDASQYKQPMRALLLTWDVHAGTEVVKVSVDASDDLKSWHSVASRAPLLHLEQNGEVLAQPRVDLHGIQARYLRITGEPAAFALTGVKVLSNDVVTPAARKVRIVDGVAGAKPGEYVFDLGARLPVEMARIVLPSNTVAPFSLASLETGGKEPWRLFANGTFYNLTRDGATLESPPVSVYPMPMRQVIAFLDSRSPPLSAPPKLEVQWRPAQLVFVARGDGPYHLEFGNREAQRSVLAVNQIIPSYEAHSEWKLAEAKVGEVQANAPPEPAWRAAMGGVSVRKVALWTILFGSVLVLAGMALKLSKQMREQPPK